MRKKKYEFSDRKKREILKILNSTQNKKSEFINLKKKFIQNLMYDRIDFVIQNYLILSNMIDKPKIYSQFAGFRSNEISYFLNKFQSVFFFQILLKEPIIDFHLYNLNFFLFLF